MNTVDPVTVVRQFDFADPARAFARLADEPMALFFDAPPGAGPQSRYAYICVSPHAVLTTDAEGRVSMDASPTGTDPVSALRAFAKPLGAGGAHDASLPPFMGGAAGFLAYEMNRFVERLPAPKPDPALGLPHMAVGLYDVIAAFNRVEKRAWIIATGLPERDPLSRKCRAEMRADWLLEQMRDPPELPAPSPVPAANLRAEVARADYESMIRQAKRYILDGDIFQANLTQRFLADLPSDLAGFDVYRRLRAATQAPMSAYLSLGSGQAILSVSPERFLQCDTHGAVSTHPIKGTRRRGPTAEDDEAMARALLSSEKDRAENLMIVDLMRNDLSRVCRVGSVKAPELFGLYSLTTVHHLVSTITGQLASGHTALDLLISAFPGGSITGAPKIRAMEIIHELEPTPRGPYCGTAFWLGHDGAMDSSILIRSPVIDGKTIAVQAGGGIVADSDPAEEYEEARLKARALLLTLSPDAEAGLE